MTSEKSKRRHDEDESSEARHRCGWIRSSDEVVVMAVERRDPVILTSKLNNQKWEDLMKEGKSFEISQQLVLEAYKRVKANHGAPGIDGEDFTSFEKDLKNNLYKLWNRMVSGSYFPNRLKEWKFPRRMAKSDCSAFQRLPTGQPKWWSVCVLNRWWNRCFMRTLMDIGRTNQQSMRCG